METQTMQKTSKIIRFNYMYRDGHNYKQGGEQFIHNPEELPIQQIEKTILSIVDYPEGERWFIPAEIGIQPLSDVESLFELPQNDYDHCYHEFQGLEAVNEEIDTENLLTVSELFEKINAKNGQPEQKRKYVRCAERSNGAFKKDYEVVITVNQQQVYNTFYIVYAKESIHFFSEAHTAMMFYQSDIAKPHGQVFQMPTGTNDKSIKEAIEYKL